MPQFSIHRKGCLHHYLLRPNAASQHYGTADSRSNASRAVEEALQLPSGLELERARLQQHKRGQKRGRRGSQSPRGSLECVIPQSRRTQNAKSALQKLGSEGPQGDFAINVQECGGLEAHRLKDQPSISPLRLSGGLIDYAESCHNPSFIASVRHDPMASMYATELHQAIDLNRVVKEQSQRTTSSRQIRREYFPASANRVRRTRRDNPYSRAPALGWNRTYDPRLPVRGARHHSKSTISQLAPLVQKQPPSPLSKAPIDKQPSSPNLSTEQVRSGSAPQITSSDSFLPPVPPSRLLTRTPSQLVALKHFTRELKRHIIAEEAVRNACLSISSPSSSTLSANTIVEFVPYLAEFQAAGLAVTSAEQRRPSNRQLRRALKRLTSKDIRDNAAPAPKVSERMDNGRAIASYDGSNISLYKDTASSRTTVIAFSTLPIQNCVDVYPTPNIATKKTMPWLRETQEPSKNSGCGSCATTIIDFSLQSIGIDGKQLEAGLSPTERQLPDTKCFDMNDKVVSRKTGEAGQPNVPDVPVPGLAWPRNHGISSRKATRNGALLLSQGPKPNRRSHAITTNPNLRKKKKTRVQGHPVPQRCQRGPLMEPTSSSSTSIGRFWALAKLFMHEIRNVKNSGAANILEDDNARTQKTIPLPSLPSAHSLRSSHAQINPIASELTYELPSTCAPGPHEFQTSSNFEQAPSDFVNHSQKQFWNERVATNLSVTPSAHRRNGNSIKRKSTAYKPPGPSLDDSNATMVSSIGFARTSSTRKTTPIDQSAIRDRDVFKGLQIALAAACDKNVDLWITKTSGCQVRRFLADLRTFEGSGVNNLVVEAMGQTKERRKDYNGMTRHHKHARVHDHERMVVREKSKPRVKKVGCVTTDGSMRPGLLAADIWGTREARTGENDIERTLGMG